jgi:hypothetical protein
MVGRSQHSTSGRQQLTLADAPAALLSNGNVLFAASPNYNAFVRPTHFFEVSTNNSISQVAEPTDAGNFTSFQWNFLLLVEKTGHLLVYAADANRTTEPVSICLSRREDVWRRCRPFYNLQFRLASATA